MGETTSILQQQNSQIKIAYVNKLSGNLFNVKDKTEFVQKSEV